VDSNVVAAIIGLISGLLGAVIAMFGQLRLSSLQARREADSVLGRYREPLVGAAYELQSRLYGILELNFLGAYYVRGDQAQRTYAVQNTLYVVAQYFGWCEILRQEIQFLSFSDSERTRAVSRRLRRVVEVFQSDNPVLGRRFLIWRGEQRAIGQLMMDEKGDQVHCLGYASFVARTEPGFRVWFERLEADIAGFAEDANLRLVELQHALVDLIRELDPQNLRYSTDALEKARAG
jgi:hypothetical protein